MHFPLIKFEKIDTPIEDWDIDADPESITLQANTDYYGELYSKEDRRDIIESEWLKNFFDGIATIDTKKETITFLNPDVIDTAIKNYLIHTISDLYVEAKKEKLRGYDLRCSGEYYKDCWSLFNIDNYWQTSFDFICDAHYHAGETWRIGNIFDAHI